MGKETIIEAWAIIKPINCLVITPNLTYARSNDLESGEEYFQGYILRNKVTFQFTKEISCRLITQYDDFTKSWEISPLVSYRLSPFTIFYAGATSNRAEIDGFGSKLTNRQFFLKLQYLFRV